MKKLLSILLCTAALAAAQASGRAPGFCLSDTTGQWRDLADYRGKVVVIEFMQTTCPHCAAFAKTLGGVAAKYGNRVQVLSIALPQDTMPMLTEFVKSKGATWPHLYDLGQVAFSYIRQPGLNFPTVFLVDQNGNIANHWEYNALTKSIFEGDQLAREIDKLLPGAAAPAKKK